MTNNINIILKDKKFVKEILKMKTSEEVQKAFLDKGIEISMEELKELAKNVSQIINDPDAKKKITDEQIENISGGDIHECLRTAAALIAGVGVGGSAMCVALKAIDSLEQADKAKDRLAARGVLGWIFGT